MLNCLFVFVVFLACIGILLAFKLIPKKETVIKTIERITNTFIPVKTKIPESTKIETLNPTFTPKPIFNKEIFPNSGSMLLTEEDLNGKTKYDLYIGRNEIFARHGYIFTNNDLKNYFKNINWYIPLYNSSEYVHDNLFSDVEKENVVLIKQKEAELGVYVEIPTETPIYTYAPYTYVESDEEAIRKDYFNKVNDIIDEAKYIFDDLNNVNPNISSLRLKMSGCYNEASILEYPSDLYMFHLKLKRGLAEYKDCLMDLENFNKKDALRHAKEGDRIINSLQYYD